MKIIKKLLRSFKHSCDGLNSAFRLELSFRLDVTIASFLIPISLLLPLQNLEKLCLITPVILLMAVELLNSGIEKTIDELGNNQYRERFKFAKDCGSAAVLLMLMLIGISWFLILY